MEITEQDFSTYIPVASSSSGYGVFDMVQDSIEVAKGFVYSLLQEELYQKVSQVDEGNYPEYTNLNILVKRYVCLYAFDRALPSLDLVLTATGFGVVSNTNVAPASSKRVERLRLQIRSDKDYALDQLLDCLRKVEQWNCTPMALKYFSSLIWRGEDLELLGYNHASRTKLEELQPEIRSAERELIHLISPQQHKSLTDYIRLNQDNQTKAMAVLRCILYIAALISRDKPQITSAKRCLLHWLESHLEDFQEYYHSRSYGANHYDPYSNKKDDTCFFFG